MTDDFTARLFDLCESSLEAIGYEVVDLEYQLEPQGWVLRVFIDHPWDGNGSDDQRGITHEDCALVSRHLGAVLDVEDPIDNQYHLEVSSPGVYRPLRRQRDFDRFKGEMVKIQMQTQIEGRRNFKGRLRSAADGFVSVEVDGRHYQLPLERIRKARLEVEL